MPKQQRKAGRSPKKLEASPACLEFAGFSLTDPSRGVKPADDTGGGTSADSVLSLQSQRSLSLHIKHFHMPLWHQDCR